MSARDPGLTRRAQLVLFARFTAVGVVAGAIAGIAADQTGTATPPWLVGTVCLVGVLLVGGATIAGAGFRPPPGAPSAISRRAPSDREAGGLRRVERTIEAGLRDPDRFNQRLRPWLVRLAEERLRHRAAVDPDSESARELLGGTLWDLMHQPLTTAPTAPQLAEWVARLEAL